MAATTTPRKSPSSLPPPRPKSPPEYPDLYGKRREFSRVQLLEREIGFVEDELKFVEGLNPASLSCKEVTDFVVANSDPFMPTSARAHKSCGFWKWLCGSPCFNLSWICCCCCTTPHIEGPNCCNCTNNYICGSGSSCMSCFCCAKTKSGCCIRSQDQDEDSKCCKMHLPCNSNCCVPPCCSNRLCKGSCCPKCVNPCSCFCARYSCYNCYLCS